MLCQKKIPPYMNSDREIWTAKKYWNYYYIYIYS